LNHRTKEEVLDMPDTKDAFHSARPASFVARTLAWRVVRALGERATQVTLAVLVVLLASSASCGTVTRVHAPTPLAARGRWVVLPVTNLADAVQAGERVEAMLDTVLREHGVGALDRYPALKEDEVHLLLSDRARYDSAFAWARSQHYDYGVTGTVEEWRYKAGNESEPAIGLTLTVIALGENKVVWSGSGAQVGSSFQNTSGVALSLLATLVDGMTLK